LTEANRLENARAEALLGDDALKAAQALLDLGLYNDAVSRAYYAAFHHARALLLLLGLEPKTHKGVISLLTQHYEGPGRLSSDALSALARLQTFRGLADYDAGTRISQERAAAEIRAARQFVEAARARLGST
jgi:uncharacterized protein (UPF0332 family)